MLKKQAIILVLSFSFVVSAFIKFRLKKYLLYILFRIFMMLK